MIQLDSRDILKTPNLRVAIYNRTSTTKEEQNNALETATTVHELLAAGNDFNSIAKQYSSNEEIDIQLSRNTVYNEFKEEVFSLKQGQISNIVTNEKGYYIFLCVSDYLEAETLANKDKIVDEYKRAQYEKIYISSNEVGLYEKYGFVFLKMLHTVWGEETQVFEKQIKDEDLSCRCNEEKGG